MGIIWLASYPKSGNTWLRFLLYNYLYKEAQKTEDIAGKIPDIHVRGTALNACQTEPLFCKTHLMLSEHHPGLADTAGFIYVLRHPKDVLLSNLNFFKMIASAKMNREAGGFSEQEFARSFIANMGVRKWISMGMGSWEEHASSWISKPRYPHIVLRYEAMRRDPHANLKNVLEFLKIPVDPDRLNRAVYLSSFEKMRAMEEAERKKSKFGPVFSHNPETAMTGMRFMNQGKSGQTLMHLGENLDQEFGERFRDALRAFEYE